MPIDSLEKADLLADLISKISAEPNSFRPNKDTETNRALLELLGIPMGVVYKGTWNAAANDPVLGDDGMGGVQGDYYVVSRDGSTEIDGITDWEIGDWIINNGTVWQKVDNEDFNNWIIPNVAFVSSSIGNNATAVVGDGNKPFQTISAAHLVSSLVYILPGTYTETIFMQPTTRYHCYEGVLFTAGGFRDNVNTVQAFVSGYGRFLGSSVALNITFGTTVLFEFDTINNTSASGIVSFNTTALANIVMRGNSMDGTTGGGFGINVRGAVNLTLEVSQFIKAFYQTILFSINYSGKAVITCPQIIMKEGGSSGNNAAFKSILSVVATTATADITINGELISELAALLTSQSVSGGISVNTSTLGRVTLNGKISAGNLRAIYSNQAIPITVNGDISSNQKIAELVNANLTIKNSKILKALATGEVNAITVGAGSSLTLEGCDITTESTDGNIIQHESLTANIKIDNVAGTTNGTGEFIRTNGAASTGTVSHARSVLGGIDTNFVFIKGFEFSQDTDKTVGFETTHDKYASLLKTTRVEGIDVMHASKEGIGIGSTPGTTGSNHLTMAIGVEHAGIADTAQLVVKDIAAGNAAVHAITELGHEIKLFRGAAVADATDAPSAITQLNALLARLRVTGGNGLIED